MTLISRTLSRSSSVLEALSLGLGAPVRKTLRSFLGDDGEILGLPGPLSPYV